MERVLPAAVLAAPTPTEADAKRALMALAARRHGIGTVVRPGRLLPDRPDQTPVWRWPIWSTTAR